MSWKSVLCCGSSAAWLLAFGAGSALAQSNADLSAAAAAAQQYLTNGADATSVPAVGQPGAAYFSNGAEMMNVPAPGQPGSDFYTNGEAAAQLPPEYVSQGADATAASNGQLDAAYFSNGAEVTAAPQPGQPGAEYFSNGAEATHIPRPGQPGAEYFSNGTSVAVPWYGVVNPARVLVTPPPTEAEPEEEAQAIASGPAVEEEQQTAAPSEAIEAEEEENAAPAGATMSVSPPPPVEQSTPAPASHPAANEPKTASVRAPRAPSTPLAYLSPHGPFDTIARGVALGALFAGVAPILLSLAGLTLVLWLAWRSRVSSAEKRS